MHFFDIMFKACSSGDLEPLREFLGRYPEMIYYKDKNGDTALHVAVRIGDLRVIGLLYEYGINFYEPNDRGSIAFGSSSEEALNYFRQEYADELLEELELDFGDLQQTIDEFCESRSGDLGVIGRILWENPTYVNLLLRSAALHGWIDMVVYALENGADINAIDQDGNTALHKAICYGHEGANVIELLLNHGANVYIVNDDGMTPIDIAIFGEDEGVTEEFIDRLELTGLVQRHLGFVPNMLDYLDQGDRLVTVEDLQNANAELLQESDMKMSESLVFLLGALFIWPASA